MATEALMICQHLIFALKSIQKFKIIMPVPTVLLLFKNESREEQILNRFKKPIWRNASFMNISDWFLMRKVLRVLIVLNLMKKNSSLIITPEIPNIAGKYTVY